MDKLNTEAAKEGLQFARDMLQKIAGPLADELGESMGVAARYYRYKLAVRMFEKTQRMLADAGINPQAVPPRLFLPIVDNASMQDDEDLHTRWAALLANAARSAEAVHPAYIEVLRQLSPRDAKLLDELYDYVASKNFRNVTVQPWITPTSYAEQQERRAKGENPEESFQDLIRLGLIETEYELDDDKIKVLYTRDGKHTKVKTGFKGDEYLTAFAIKFARACRAPGTVIESSR